MVRRGFPTTCPCKVAAPGSVRLRRACGRGRRRACGRGRPRTREVAAPSQGERSQEQCAVCGIPAPFAPHPPAPCSHEGRRGSLSVLMPETDDGAQGLPQKPDPVRWQRLGARASGAPAGGDAGAPAGGDARASRPHVVQSFLPIALSGENAVALQGLPRAQGGLQPARAPARQPRRGFHVLREGFSPHERPRRRASPSIAEGFSPTASSV